MSFETRCEDRAEEKAWEIVKNEFFDINDGEFANMEEAFNQAKANGELQSMYEEAYESLNWEEVEREQREDDMWDDADRKYDESKEG